MNNEKMDDTVTEEKDADKENKKTSKEEKKESKRLQKELETAKKEAEGLRADLEDQRKQTDAVNDRYLRMMAEYDNFRKRAAAEKDGVYASACEDIFKEILPVIDALEMATRYGNEDDPTRKGIEMTLSKFKEALAKLGMSEIETKNFDPNFHNAVMHIEDEAFGENEIVEVFQKGYKKGDKVIRYAMVKVAN